MSAPREARPGAGFSVPTLRTLAGPILGTGAAIVTGYLAAGIADTRTGLLAAAAVAMSSGLFLLRPVRAGERAWLGSTPLGDVALGVLLAAVTTYLAFNAGGYFGSTFTFVTALMALLLVLRLALAREPLGGLGPWLGAAGAALLLLAAWQLLSGTWSHAPGRALLEAERTSLYLFTLLFFGSFTGTPERTRWLLRGLLAAIVVVCTVALATRLFPDRFPVPPNLGENRLSYPVTYWNALGVMATLGLVLAVYLTTSARQSVAARLLGALVTPVLAVTLLFTFSRGAIAVTPIGLVVYLVAARPRGVLGLIPPTIAAYLAVRAGYNADLLASDTPTSAGAAVQGHEVARVVAACALGGALGRLAIMPLDRPLLRLEIDPQVRRAVLGGAAALAVIAFVGIAAAFDLPATVHRQYEGFVQGSPVGTAQDQRTRLTSPGSNGRVGAWRLALREYGRAPSSGQGAGTYELLYLRERASPLVQFRDAHSLYIELLAELGWPGLVLLLVACAAVLARVLMLTRRRGRTAYAAVLAALATWAVHAGTDWDWEMPAITLGMFALAGTTLAARRRDARVARTPSVTRVAAGFAVLGAALVASHSTIAQTHLDRAEEAVLDDQYARAATEAQRSTRASATFAEPFEALGYSELGLGRPAPAVAAMRAAVERDPGYWRYHYGLALAEATAGQDPRAAAHRALELDRFEPMAQDGVSRFVSGRPADWRAGARDAGWPTDPER